MATTIKGDDAERHARLQAIAAVAAGLVCDYHGRDPEWVESLISRARHIVDEIQYQESEYGQC